MMTIKINAYQCGAANISISGHMNFYNYFKEKRPTEIILNGKSVVLYQQIRYILYT